MDRFKFPLLATVARAVWVLNETSPVLGGITRHSHNIAVREGRDDFVIIVVYFLESPLGSVRFFVCGSISCFASNTLESCSNAVNWSRRDRLSKAVGSSRANCE